MSIMGRCAIAEGGKLIVDVREKCNFPWLLTSIKKKKTLPVPEGRQEELELATGQETLTALRDGEGGGEGGGEWEGVGRRGRNGNFYKLVNFYKKKDYDN